MIEQIQMTKDELAELPEYSCSFPTMTTIGNDGSGTQLLVVHHILSMDHG